MKKILTIAMTVALAALILSAGTGLAGTKTFKLRLSTVVTPPHPWTIAADFMAKEIKARTDGQVIISVHASSSLGTDQTTIDEMRMGTIDLVIGGVSPAAVFVPEFQIFSLPYLFKDYDTYMKVTASDSPVFKRFQNVYEERKLNLVLLALCGGGVRDTSNNLKPIVKPSDMQGMKMRVPGNPVVTKIWAAAGAIPSPMPWKEIYSAMQTGVVNCFESTISGYYGSRYYEVAPYHSKTQHQFMTSHISMSKATFKRLPENYRKIIAEVATEAGLLVTRTGREFDNTKLDKLVEKHGVKVNEVDKAAFLNLFTPLQDELAAEIKLTGLLEQIRAIK